METNTVLITGASSGIGVDIAAILAERKYNLILVARREERLMELKNKLQNEHNILCHSIVCDLTNHTDLHKIMDSALSWTESKNLELNILVNNAGNGFWGEFQNQTTDNHESTICLNVTAPTVLCHQFIQNRMGSESPSWILNVSSLSAILPAPRFAVYSGSKSYLKSFSEVLAHELRHSNISVTCSCPGGVLTEFMEQAGQTLKRNTGMMQSRDVAEQMVNAMFKGMTTQVPGMFNKLASASSFLPISLRSKIVERSMNVTVK